MLKFPFASGMRGVRALLLTMLLALPVAAIAGRSCDDRPPTASSITQGMSLAQRVAERLESLHLQSGTRVVVLARAGQDLSKYGLRYSHLGFAYRTAEGPWRVLHKLNQCGTAESAIYLQGVGEFFLDDPWRYEAAWVVPAPDVQARLHALLTDPSRNLLMHVKPYSMVSYAWGRTYQQSNQWAIETLAMALEPSIRNRTQAQAWLQFKGYEPSALTLRMFTRLGGRITAANIAFDDHPNEKRFADRIETVTVDSIFDWMARTGLASGPEAM